MTFWILIWIFVTHFPLQTHLEFVVREKRACCHHQISLQCSEEDYKLAIIQARYIAHVKRQEEEKVAAVIDSSVFTSSSPLDDQLHLDNFYQSHHPFIHPSRPSVSLWDLDIKFSHELQEDGVQRPFTVNNLPEWHPDHFSNTAVRRRFFPARPTIPSNLPMGSNYSTKKKLEMPVYSVNFLDINTIWRQPLFPVLQSETSESSSMFLTTGNPNLRADENKCLSYQTLMNAAEIASATPIDKSRNPGWGKTTRKLNWNFKDLRTYFNRRCSGKSKCEVNLLKNLGQDEEITQICKLMPDGKIIVKYLCFNASAGISHTKCNIDITPAAEGFVWSQGYPELYYGDKPCQYRLHVPHQKMLLIFFDISLRVRGKNTCRDELTVTEAQQLKIFSTCGDHDSAVAVLSETHQINITLVPKSRLAFPKRGFLVYYRVIGCSDPFLPYNSYLSFRNATMAKIMCSVGHVFPDTLARTRLLYCSPLDHRWLGNFPFCDDIRNFLGRNASIDAILKMDPSVWPVKLRESNPIYFTEIELPIIVLLLIFAFHGGVLYWIWRQRSRLEEIENQTNQEMERMCGATNSMEGGSIFSFPDSLEEDLWDHDFDHELDTDQDRTLTTLTLQTDTSNSSTARKTADFSQLDEKNGHFHFPQNFSNSAQSHKNRNCSCSNYRPNIGYVQGHVLPLSFNGYFRQTSV